MANGIYIGMAAASAQARALDVVADNLANSSTPGFKAGRITFRQAMAAQPDALGALADKVQTAVTSSGVDLRPGAIENTENPLDVLPRDGAFLAVRAPDGSTAYTRDGRLSVALDGVLLASGRPVLNEGGNPILVPPQSSPRISNDGVVHVGDLAAGRLATARLSRDIQRLGNGMVTTSPENVTPTEPRLTTGVIERGNEPAMQSVIKMMQAQRSFTNAMQVIDTYKGLDQRTSNIGRR